MTRKEFKERLIKFINTHPDMTYAEMAQKLRCSVSTISRLATEQGVFRNRKPLSEADLENLGE